MQKQLMVINHTIEAPVASGGRKKEVPAFNVDACESEVDMERERQFTSTSWNGLLKTQRIINLEGEKKELFCPRSQGQCRLVFHRNRHSWTYSHEHL